MARKNQTSAGDDTENTEEAVSTVSAIPMHTVIVARPNGQTDKDGNDKYSRFTPPIGQPFDFTQTEFDDIRRMSPACLRQADGSVDFDEAIDQAGAAAAFQAIESGGAPKDAANVAKEAISSPTGGRLPKSMNSDPDAAEDDEEL